MLQVARLAPNLLQAAADPLADFLRGRFNPDGGAADRGGKSDLYYTAFGLDGLIALRRDPPADGAAPWLERFGDGDGLDFVHLACLARAWAALPGRMPEGRAEALASRVRGFRADDGGFAAAPGLPRGTVYHAFLGVGALQDLGRAVDAPERLAASVAALQAKDGSFVNGAGPEIGTTPTTAGAVVLLHAMRAPLPRGAADWLLERARPEGGFTAVPQAPIPDLLSTAVALHALSILKVPVGYLREPTLDFVDSLWTGTSFCGSWEDDVLDAEYAFYALLALGHLSLA